MKNVIYASSCAIDRIQTGKNIRRFRQSRGLSVMDVSNLFGGLARNSIYKWERGDTLPSIDNLYSLAWVFGVSLDELVAGNRESLDRGDDDQLVELLYRQQEDVSLTQRDIQKNTAPGSFQEPGAGVLFRYKTKQSTSRVIKHCEPEDGRQTPFPYPLAPRRRL
ncbi:MAG TPA: helix-turn-helix transcriptional regulator [Candidatus Faecousia faecigallinarum]|nr:helix-turn-helix transcriptional regulator [Candidatus Faecousia faecigallinarum]